MTMSSFLIYFISQNMKIIDDKDKEQKTDKDKEEKTDLKLL